MKRLTTLVLVAVAMLAQSARAAISISVSEINPTWINILPPTVVGLTVVTVPGSSELKWGVFADSNAPQQPQSSFKFVGVASNNLAIGQVFDIGTFTFTNNPLKNTPPFAIDPNEAGNASITGATLSLSLKLSVDGGATVTLGPLDYVFTHSEQLVNGNGDDIATITNYVSAPTFQIGSQLYTLFLSGFLAGNDQFVSSLAAPEAQQPPSAVIRGFFAVADVTPPNPEAPEPLSILLWGGLGVAGVAASRRRKDQTA